MARCIVFVRGVHLEWSTTLAAPASSGMARADMEMHLAARGMTAEAIGAVLDAAEEDGAAMLNDPAVRPARVDVLSANGLGPDGTSLTAREVVDLLTGGAEVLY